MKTKKLNLFYDPNQQEWDYAIISSGFYGTKDYYSKDYCSKTGLKKGLIAHGYKEKQPFNGERWNYGGKQYKVSFDYK
jgi:hypothetical protein